MSRGRPDGASRTEELFMGLDLEPDVLPFPDLAQDPELDARCQFCAGEGWEICADPASCEKAHSHGMHACVSCQGTGRSRSVW